MLGKSRFSSKLRFHNKILIIYSVPMGISGKTMGCMFAPVPVEIASYDPETVGRKCPCYNKFTPILSVFIYSDVLSEDKDLCQKASRHCLRSDTDC